MTDGVDTGDAVVAGVGGAGGGTTTGAGGGGGGTTTGAGVGGGAGVVIVTAVGLTVVSPIVRSPFPDPLVAWNE